MNNKELKLSIIIPNYNNEKYLDKSISSLINQSYKNLEIIVVNDGSPGNCDELVEKYMKIDDRVKYIKHDVNKGLFHARVTGSTIATGDYIAFLDADDYVSCDFYRNLINDAASNNSDISIGNTALEYDDGKKIEFTLFKFHFKSLDGTDGIDEYFKQHGLNFLWHAVWNKIYSIDIWKKAMKYYTKQDKRLIMTEDFAFSTVLFYYAKKITFVDASDAIFYCQHNNTSTSIKNMSPKKARNNIRDLITSYSFIESFLKEENIYDKYKDYFIEWKHLYSLDHRYQIDHATGITKSEAVELNKELDEFCSDRTLINNHSFLTYVESNWCSQLENLKLKIKSEKIKCVSFDIFDTLLLRPFYTPTDLFSFLNPKYEKLSGSSAGALFSKMRIIAEKIARDDIITSEIQDINLDQIYDKIHELYKIDNDILDKLKEEEKKLEIRFSSRRNTMYRLFNFCLECGKKVVLTSDMYLPKNVIEKMLVKNGYIGYDKFYLSCEILKSKASSDLYSYVISDLGLSPDEMIHIGDNYLTDYENPKRMGIDAIHIRKPIDMMIDKNFTGNLSSMITSSLPFWQDNKEAMSFIGVRTMLGVVANKYFDNPFMYFNNKTDFNQDPYLVGYYALGMYVFGVTNWLLKDTIGKNDKISFMARDGYLVMEAYKILKQLYENCPKEEYMYVSRKALIPVMITEKLDFYRLPDLINIDSHTPKSIVKFISGVVDINIEKLEELCSNNNIDFNQKFKNLEEFNKYINIVVDNFYDEDKHNSKRLLLKEYFSDILGNNPAVFDVGYSGRPEFYISYLTGNKIDTYFLNINKDEALDYCRKGNFKIKTYFDSKPTATGNAYELLLSKIAPSCIGYDIKDGKVKEVFEDYTCPYQVSFVVETMQNASLEFVSDMVNIFGSDIDLLYYQDYYINLPILGYFNSSIREDKSILYCVEFEDEIRTGETRRMIDDMQNDLDSKNQCDLKTLTSIKNKGLLSDKNKLEKFIYYFIFDKDALKKRIKFLVNKYIFRRNV